MVEIEWIVEDEQRQALEPHLHSALRYAPPWLTQLSVRYDPSLDDIAGIHVLFEYRTAHMKIGNSWFSESSVEREVALTHEMMHTHVQALDNVFKGLLEACDPAEPLAKWAKEQWRLAEEATVSDLARVLVSRG